MIDFMQCEASITHHSNNGNDVIYSGNIDLDDSGMFNASLHLPEGMVGTYLHVDGAVYLNDDMPHLKIYGNMQTPQGLSTGTFVYDIEGTIEDDKIVFNHSSNSEDIKFSLRSE
ncbi:hypothetical protein LUA82_01740 [Neoehrlichia mikurensis]|uniref:Uncharacterized protein n=1 Tax=Neoehrlichia mikurensis TaxID=89586 RepID=A0A9Q9C0B8_9RICK|nr:hypothetical protein [Neoehrlichia mikurensis]UTO55779.1 hypothetical protein LUA82_01740 [Neoehrlichia mikurensis]UTO56694.1 hypothetical protein LUA81_01730 [Neoehrlichia mikurensis]